MTRKLSEKEKQATEEVVGKMFHFLSMRVKETLAHISEGRVGKAIEECIESELFRGGVYGLIEGFKIFGLFALSHEQEEEFDRIEKLHWNNIRSLTVDEFLEVVLWKPSE